MGVWVCQGAVRMVNSRIIECGWEHLLGERAYHARHRYSRVALG